MAIELDAEQREALSRGAPVYLIDPDSGVPLILVRADGLDDLALEIRERKVFRSYAGNQASRLARDNPY